MRIYWERGLNYRFRQRVRLGGVVTESTFFEEDATLNGRIGLKLGVDVAGYLERGSVPHLGTRFDLRRALFYTTGEFSFLCPILFKFDLGGVGDQLYFSDFYFWARDVPYVGTIKFGQFDAPMSLEAAHRQYLRDVHGVRLAGRGLRAGPQGRPADRRPRARRARDLGRRLLHRRPGGRTSATPAPASLDSPAVPPGSRCNPGPPPTSLIHLGVSASYVLSSRDRIRYKSRPESFLAQDLVDTGDLDTEQRLSLRPRIRGQARSADHPVRVHGFRLRRAATSATPTSMARTDR